MFIANVPAMRLPLFDKKPWIYAVRVDRLGLIKIGHTTCFGERVNGLKSQYRSDVEPLGIMAAKRQDERVLHKTLDVHRYPGDGCYELYWPNPEIMALIQRRMVHPSSVYDSLPRIIEYIGKHPAQSLPITLVQVEKSCHEILNEKRPAHCRPSKQKNRLINRVLREVDAGHDMSQAMAVIKERLGVDLSTFSVLDKARVQFELDLPNQRSAA